MWATILAPLKALGAWFVGLMFNYVIGWVKDAITRHLERKEQSRIDKENAEKLKKAIEAGKDEDIEKATEDLLNGRKS